MNVLTQGQLTCPYLSGQLRQRAQDQLQGGQGAPQDQPELPMQLRQGAAAEHVTVMAALAQLRRHQQLERVRCCRCRCCHLQRLHRLQRAQSQAEAGAH